MNWFETFDLGLLRLINQTLSNSFFDVVMPFASGNRLFIPIVILAAALLIWKGGTRGRVSVLMLILIVLPGDPLICNTIKHAVGRPRPFVEHSDILTPASNNRRNTGAAEDKLSTRSFGKSSYNSMPSSHAANWFAATTILFVYFRRSLRIMFPLACLVSFSRIYNGVHYPSDVLAGAILGGGYAVAGLWGWDALWRWAGRKWFPFLWQQLPSLANPDLRLPKHELETLNDHPSGVALRDPDALWLRFGYVVIAALLLFRLFYINSDVIQLSEDEAYQWVWSKHPALSYFSKPPMIAYTQFVGTHLWGDTQFGVRFFSPVLAALTVLFLLRFMKRYVSGLAGFVLVLIASTTPLLQLGSTLMTVDPLSVFFWVLAMVFGWRAVQPESTAKDWIWTGLWMGLGFLSKYTALFQWLCWLVFFVACKRARVQLRRPGPYLALLVNALCALPVLIWNSQHHWTTVSHVAENAGLAGKWSPRIFDFLGLEFVLLNPVYFLAAAWAAIAFWRRMRDHALGIYLFSMGAPLFLCYLLWSIHSRVFPNWIAPSVPALFCLMVLYWRDVWNQVDTWAGKWLNAGLILGLIAVIFMHDTNLAGKIIGRSLPRQFDPLVRVRGWRESAEMVGEARRKLELEGKPVFIIGGHYGITSLINFYLPEARTNIDQSLLAYAITSEQPKNQYYFWPGYKELRQGQNAIFIRELPTPKLWKSQPADSAPKKEILPAVIQQEFESVTDLGQFDVFYRDRVIHSYQLFECRNLK